MVCKHYTSKKYNQNAYIEIVKLRHLCGDAPSMWHILVRLVYGCQDLRE